MEPTPAPASPFALANVRRFVVFRVCFNARFYYPVFTILFLDFGLTIDQFAVLNAVWAATIVLLEVPSGALADVVGRRNLLVAAGVLMVGEMLLLCFAPVGASGLLFWLFAANRVLSGAAEAAASGADEALAYDTLRHHGMEGEWSRVLERQMRLQSAANLVVMSVGAMLYDPAAVGWIAGLLGWEAAPGQGLTLRIPLFLTLAMAVATLSAALGMGERRDDPAPGGSALRLAAEAFRKTFSAGAWILRTPSASVLIACGLVFDHVARVLITLNSQYYRLIRLPEATFGLISSGLALLGLFLPKIARGLAASRRPGTNLLVVAALLMTGMLVMGRFVPWVGILAPVCIFSVLLLNAYFVSHYLNPLTDSSRRATVLSFKGLSYNLGYGGLGILYSLLLAGTRGRLSAHSELAGPALEDEVFRQSVQWFPAYFLVAFAVLLVWARWRLRAEGPAGGGGGRF